jgi:hypothetical protein
MKQCNRCKQALALDMFNSKGKNKIQSYCKPCAREYARENYHKNREANADKQRLSKKARMNAIKVDVRKLKEDTPCMDCGVQYPYYCMDFDHVNGKKVTHISEMIHNASAKWKIFSEITKCEIVCANCHRKRTHRRAAALYKLEQYEQQED